MRGIRSRPYLFLEGETEVLYDEDNLEEEMTLYQGKGLQRARFLFTAVRCGRSRENRFPRRDWTSMVFVLVKTGFNCVGGGKKSGVNGQLLCTL